MDGERGQSGAPEADSGLQALQSEITEAIGPELELLRHLGSGRMAHVFLAREAALRRLVAVKVLKPSVGRDEATLARFDREARAAAAIKHPRVPSVHRIGMIESGLPFIVQEFIEGRTLQDRLSATGAVEPAEARRILSQLASALEASHAKGVIHRDVRPGNVIIEEETGDAFLTDFGLAAARESSSIATARITRQGEVLGDLRYIGPEQLRGDPVTAQADIFSLGVMGYEMLTLSNPFESRLKGVGASAAIRNSPTDFPWRVTAADPDLAQILMKCLNPEPSKRPSSRDIRTVLDDHSDGGGAGGPMRSTAALLAPFPRLAAFVAELRRRHVYQVAAAYVVGALLLLEPANLVLEGLGAPPILYSIVVVATLTGFPVVIALSWAYEVTKRGIERTEPSPDSPMSRSWRIVGLAASILVAVALGWLILG